MRNYSKMFLYTLYEDVRKTISFFHRQEFKKYKNSEPRLNGKNLCLKLVYNLFYLTPLFIVDLRLGKICKEGI